MLGQNSRQEIQEHPPFILRRQRVISTIFYISNQQTRLISGQIIHFSQT